MSTQIALLKKYGLPIRGHVGQHLLIDPNMQHKIVQALDPQAEEPILEIGPGLGALTLPLLQAGCRVWAIEKDARFVEILQGELGTDYRKRLTILNGDVLEIPLDKWQGRSERPWKVVSNLPYYITAPVLFHVLRYRRVFSKGIFMMQKEVAKRLVAMPGSKDYGRLTLAVRYAADVRHLFDVSPACFTPRPAVNSSVVELSMHPESRIPSDVPEKMLFYLIKVAFGQRRKTLLSILAHDPHLKTDKNVLADLFEKLGFKKTIRGEDLLLKDFLELSGAFTADLACVDRLPDFAPFE